MANKVERLKCIMKVHYLSVCPNTNALRPQVRAQKEKTKGLELVKITNSMHGFDC